MKASLWGLEVGWTWSLNPPPPQTDFAEGSWDDVVSIL